MDKIIKNFKEKKGLAIFQPRDGGRGSSNDGNTARRALKDHDFMSEQTGLSAVLFKRINVIRVSFASTRKASSPDELHVMTHYPYLIKKLFRL